MIRFEIEAETVAEAVVQLRNLANQLDGGGDFNTLTADPILSMREVTRMLDMSDANVNKLVKAGELRGFRIGSRMKFRTSVIEDYVRRLEFPELADEPEPEPEPEPEE